jgi:hypothetical protein
MLAGRPDSFRANLTSSKRRLTRAVPTLATITLMAREIAPRSRLAWLAIVARLSAAVLAGVALLAEGQSARWVLFAGAAGLAIVPFAFRPKAAVVSGAIFATSADYVRAGQRGDQFPGELSVTVTTLTWNPSRHSIAKDLSPLHLAMRDCESISMKGGTALLDVLITVNRRNGGEWLFVTHRSPGLRRAIAALNERITP